MFICMSVYQTKQLNQFCLNIKLNANKNFTDYSLRKSFSDLKSLFFWLRNVSIFQKLDGIKFSITIKLEKQSNNALCSITRNWQEA